MFSNGILNGGGFGNAGVIPDGSITVEKLESVPARSILANTTGATAPLTPVTFFDTDTKILDTFLPDSVKIRYIEVANETARFALTKTADVQNGDRVLQNDTEILYFVKDDTNLNNASGWGISNEKISWNDVLNKPTDIFFKNTDGAIDVSYNNTTSGLTAENVQDAIDELNTEKEPTVTAGTSSQYYRGDKTFQTLDKTAVGLSNVPNTDATNLANDTIQGTFTPNNTAIVTSDTGKVIAEKTQGQLNKKVDVSTAQTFTNIEKRQGSYNINGTPFFTEAERDALTWNNGNFIFNTTAKVIQEYQNGSWTTVMGGGFDSEYIGDTTIWKFGESTVPNTKIILDGRLYLKADWAEGWAWAISNNLTTNNESLYNASKNYFYDVDVNSFRPPADGGYFYRGLDTTGTIDPDGATRDLGSIQVDMVGTHTHPVTSDAGVVAPTTTSAASKIDVAGGGGMNPSVANTMVSLNTFATGVNTGGGAETRPKNIAVYYIMKFKSRVPLQNELIDGENSTVITEEVGGVMQTKVNVVLPNVLNPNYIINGDFQHWQRGTSIEYTGGNPIYFACEWWGRRGSQHTGQVVSKQFDAIYKDIARVQRKAGNALSGDLNLCQNTVTLNVEKFAGKTITYSAWVKLGADFASASGTVAMNIDTGTVANDTRTPYAFTTGNVNIGTVSTSTTKGVWQKLVTTVAVPLGVKSMLVQFVALAMQGTAGANDYFEVAQVKWEPGSSATEFASPDYFEELEKCKVYYERLTSNEIKNIDSYRATSTTTAITTLRYTNKRIIPTLSISTVSGVTLQRASGNIATTGVTFAINNKTQSVQINLTVASGLTTSETGEVILNDNQFIEVVAQDPFV